MSAKPLSWSLRVVKEYLMSEQAQQGKALLSIITVCLVSCGIGAIGRLRVACWLFVLAEGLAKCTVDCKQDIFHSFSFSCSV